MEDLRKEAERFLAEQFAIMSRHGCAPNLSPEQKEELTLEVQQTFRRLVQMTETGDRL